MKTYHKIQNVFNRDMDTHLLIEEDWKMPEFEYLANNEWTFTEKVDGTNIRVMWDGHSITFGGKTDRAQLHKDLLRRLDELFDSPELFIEVFGNTPVCLYGEGYGAEIQKGACIG